MRTVPYAGVFRRVCRGREMDAAALGQWDRELVTDAINLRVAEGWAWARWPEWTRAVEVDTTDVDPWAVVLAGTILMVTDRDPGAGPYITLGWRRTDEGVAVAPALDKVWVTYQPPAPVFSSEQWLADEDYGPGDVVFFGKTEANPAGDGECYRCILATSGVEENAPGGACWEPVLFPAVLEDWVVLAAAANLLRGKNNFDDAWKAENAARTALVNKVAAEVPHPPRARR